MMSERNVIHSEEFENKISKKNAFIERAKKWLVFSREATYEKAKTIFSEHPDILTHKDWEMCITDAVDICAKEAFSSLHFEGVESLVQFARNNDLNINFTQFGNFKDDFSRTLSSFSNSANSVSSHDIERVLDAYAFIKKHHLSEKYFDETISVSLQDIFSSSFKQIHFGEVDFLSLSEQMFQLLAHFDIDIKNIEHIHFSEYNTHAFNAYALKLLSDDHYDRLKRFESLVSRVGIELDYDVLFVELSELVTHKETDKQEYGLQKIKNLENIDFPLNYQRLYSLASNKLMSWQQNPVSEYIIKSKTEKEIYTIGFDSFSQEMQSGNLVRANSILYHFKLDLLKLSEYSESMLVEGINKSSQDDFDVYKNIRVIKNLFIAERMDADVIDEQIHTLLFEMGLSKNLAEKFTIETIELVADEEIFDALIQNVFTHDRVIALLNDIIYQQKNSFKNFIFELSNTEEFDPENDENLIRKMLFQFGGFSKNIFQKCKMLDSKEKIDAFLHQIRDLKKTLFRNIDISSFITQMEKITGMNGYDTVADVIVLAYPPTTYTIKDIRSLLKRVDDHSTHLEQYQFPDDGYDITIRVNSSQKEVRQGEEIDTTVLSDIEKLTYPHSDQEKIDGLSKTLQKVARASTMFDINDLRNILHVVPTSSTERIHDADSLENQQEIYRTLREVEEIFNVMFRNHLPEYVESVFKKYPAIYADIHEVFNSEKRFNQFLIQLGKDFDWRWGDESIDREVLTEREISQLIATYIFKKIITNSKFPLSINKINKELKKFVDVDEEPDHEKKEFKTKRIPETKILKAYFSKNVASFFAKDSVGICTADDIALWDRPNHFHINLVERGRLMANIQAYIINDDSGQNSLLLRGFNPSSSIIPEIDIKNFINEVLRIAREFMQENNLNKLYIPEQSNFNALTNRKEVEEYLLSTFVSLDNQIPYEFNVSTYGKIHHIYEI